MLQMRKQSQRGSLICSSISYSFLTKTYTTLSAEACPCYLKAFLAFSTFGAPAPLPQALISPPSTRPCGLSFLILHLIARKSRIQRNWQRCLSMGYPCLLHFSAFIPMYIMGYVFINFSLSSHKCVTVL